MNSVFKFSTSTFLRVKKSVEALRLDLDGSRELIWGGGCIFIHSGPYQNRLTKTFSAAKLKLFTSNSSWIELFLAGNPKIRWDWLELH